MNHAVCAKFRPCFVSWFRNPFREMSSEIAPKVIGTHSGCFHCDESLACFLIQQLAEYKNCKIVRSRDDTVLDKCDIVVDVGAVYDPARNRFDHHQSTFNTTLVDLFPTKKFGNVKLSSAGLIYAHFGHEIIGQLCGWKEDDSKTDKIFDMVYQDFVKEIDAIDNGVNMFEGEPLYKISTHLSARVSHLTPSWNEDNSDEVLYRQFLKAVELAGGEFKHRVDYYGKVWMAARTYVVEAFEKRTEVDPSGRIVLIKQQLPWIQHLFQIEEESNLTGHVYYTIFPDKNTWRVRAVPVSYGSFELRKPLPKQWHGLRNEELDRVSQIQGCVFVHSTGFIGGTQTEEGAIQMAIKSLSLEDDS